MLNPTGLISTACRLVMAARSSGNSSAGGIRAPSTRIGTTRTFLLKAALTSSRTKSSGLSRRRRPLSSVIVSHCGPINASSTSQAATASVIRSTKSSPGSMSSTSLKTDAAPKRATSTS
ncbi:MAG: hypothetical protein WBH64_00340 [Propionicimonas sp.]